MAAVLPGGLRYYGFEWQHLKSWLKPIPDVHQENKREK
ncbi:hypothetical protein MRBBS_1858 [Marinobacter sp. BSs20148]|nr:hypothetical protein MRBBS_1858 [Marinobacter sp. BSs20148]